MIWTGCEWIDEIRINNTSAKKKTPFIKGPIPRSWITTACKLPYSAAVKVALALWYLHGIRGDTELNLTSQLAETFGCNRKAKYSGLKALEAAGLIAVVRNSTKNPRVAILATEDHLDAATHG